MLRYSRLQWKKIAKEYDLQIDGYDRINGYEVIEFKEGGHYQYDRIKLSHLNDICKGFDGLDTFQANIFRKMSRADNGWVHTSSMDNVKYYFAEVRLLLENQKKVVEEMEKQEVAIAKQEKAYENKSAVEYATVVKDDIFKGERLEKLEKLSDDALKVAYIKEVMEEETRKERQSLIEGGDEEFTKKMNKWTFAIMVYVPAAFFASLWIVNNVTVDWVAGLSALVMTALLTLLLIGVIGMRIFAKTTRRARLTLNAHKDVTIVGQITIGILMSAACLVGWALVLL